MDTKLVANSKYVQFYEGMNDPEIPNPNSRHLNSALGIPLSENHEEAPILIPPTLDSQHKTFTIIHDAPVRLLCDHDTLGVIIGS